MTTGYLIALVLLALPTLCALRPMRRPAVLAWLRRRLGRAVGTLPLVAFSWLATATAMTVDDGGVGPLGWTFSGLIAAGLVVLIVRGVRSAAALRRSADRGDAGCATCSTSATTPSAFSTRAG